jgi:hypothetical protein
MPRLIQKPTAGRIVLVSLQNPADPKGVISRPAIVVQAFDGGHLINAKVLLDCNDASVPGRSEAFTLDVTSIPFDADGILLDANGDHVVSWRWLPRCDDKIEVAGEDPEPVDSCCGCRRALISQGITNDDARKTSGRSFFSRSNMEDEDCPAENANARGATIIDARVDFRTVDVMREPDGRFVLEDIDIKASKEAKPSRAFIGECEACTTPCALRPISIQPAPWQVIEPNAGMLENVVADVPSSLRGGMFREVWACSDACERALLKWAGLDPSTAGLKNEAQA